MAQNMTEKLLCFSFLMLVVVLILHKNDKKIDETIGRTCSK